MRMVPSKIILQLFLIAVILSTFSLTPGPAAAGPNASITIYNIDYLGPYIIDPTLIIGDEFIVDVLATLPPVVSSTDGGANGFDVFVRYNSTILKAVDANYKGTLCPPAEGCRFSTGLEISKAVDNPPGITR